jgi:hypothetical protein
MTWLLRLYPAPWRRRYGDEVAALIADRAFSFSMAVDLVAGAIDVWLHPSITLAAASAAAPHTEEKNMLSRLARLGCAGALGPDVTRADQAKAAIVTLGGTIALTLVWMTVRSRIGENAYLDALSALAFLAPIVVSMRYTSLKRRPGSVQAIFIGGLLLVVTAILLTAALIADRV